MTDLRHATGADVRIECRNGKLSGPTPGLALGFVQANLVLLPRDWAFDFLLFCQRNPKPCPLLDVTEVGDPEAKTVAPGTRGTLRRGLSAHVTWNGNTLDGEISAINPAIENGTVKFFVALNQQSDSRLRSNLRVDIAVITERKGISLRVTKGPFLTGGDTQDVFVVDGDRALRTPVTFGVHGFDYVEVVKGLKKGDEIVLSDMKDYLHVKEVKLK